MPPSEPTVRLVVDLVAGRTPATRDVDWQRATDLLAAVGLDALAVAVHRSTPYLPRTVAEAMEPSYLTTALHTRLTLEAARRAREALEGAGVPSLLYKGAALVEAGVYADPGARAMDDADLLVPPHRAEEAVRALRAAGFEPWTGWSPETVEWLDSATFADGRTPSGPEVAVDLHWRLGYGGLRYGGRGGEDTSGLWQDADGARGLPAPGAHLVVIVEHLLKHLHVRFHLPGLADVVRLSRDIDDWSPVRRRLEERPAGRSVARILDAARRGFDAAVPDGCTAGAGSGPGAWASRRLLAPETLVARAAGRSGRLRGLLYRWLLSGSPAAALEEIRATLVPGGSWLRARYAATSGAGGDEPTRRLLFRYWGEVVRWLAGRGVSPVSPNQELEEWR